MAALVCALARMSALVALRQDWKQCHEAALWAAQQLTTWQGPVLLPAVTHERIGAGLVGVSV